MPKNKKDLKIGHKFMKPDIERLGVFVDADFTTGKYTDPPFLKRKGYTFLTDHLKNKDGTQRCYFDKEPLKILFIGEAIKGRGRKPPKKNPFISKNPLLRPDGPKLHSTPGDFFGTFTDEYMILSPLTRRIKKSTVKTRPNIYTQNPKKGGPGYLDITINPYPTQDNLPKPKVKKPSVYGKILDGPVYVNLHPQEYFDKNPYKDPPNIKPGPFYKESEEKKISTKGTWTPVGPNKLEAGEYFSIVPAPKKDPYMNQLDVEKTWLKKANKKNLAGPYVPQSTAFKTMFTTSIINKNLYKIHVNNVHTVEPKFTKRLTC